MAHTYDELRRKTVAELREIAKDTVQGSSQMNKDHLLPVLCQALGIETHGASRRAGDRQGRRQGRDARAQIRARSGRSTPTIT